MGRKIAYNHAFNLLEDANLLKRVTDYKVIGENMKISDDHSNTRRCSSAKYHGRFYALGDYIISNCLLFAWKILKIGVNDEANQLFLVIGVYNISYITNH